MDRPLRALLPAQHGLPGLLPSLDNQTLRDYDVRPRKHIRARELDNLVIVLGDQLNHDSTAFDGFDRSRDAVWMAEVEEAR